MAKTQKLGTVWTAGAEIQVIEGTTWKTIGTCSYTPRAINEALKAAGIKSGWVRWTCGREMWRQGREIAEMAK
jgi:hypothetical protein